MKPNLFTYSYGEIIETFNLSSIEAISKFENGCFISLCGQSANKELTINCKNIKELDELYDRLIKQWEEGASEPKSSFYKSHDGDFINLSLCRSIDRAENHKEFCIYYRYDGTGEDSEYENFPTEAERDAAFDKIAKMLGAA